VRYHLVNALVLNEVQKQDRHIEAQKNRIADLEDRLSRIEALIKGGRGLSGADQAN
jgi:type II secretory pathway component PulJ